MRHLIKDLMVIVKDHIPAIEPIHEFGSLQVPGQEDFADLRALFAGKEYKGSDMREGYGVDMILNLHHIDLPDNSIGTALCLDTLEHVEDPRKAVEEMYRVIKPNGWLIISSVMKFPIHDYPNDYWRFTPEAFRSILKPFKTSFVEFVGADEFPHTVIGIGFKGDMPDLAKFKEEIAKWKVANCGKIKKKKKHFWKKWL